MATENSKSENESKNRKSEMSIAEAAIKFLNDGKKRGGGRLSRSETVTVRINPKLRFLAELAARKQRRTLSSFIEWAIEESLNYVQLDNQPDKSVADKAYLLWDVDEADRFAKLAYFYSDLLSFEEQVLWKIIKENGALWKGHYDESSFDWVWDTSKISNLLLEVLREHWDKFVAVANGEVEKSVLPTWKKTKNPL